MRPLLRLQDVRLTARSATPPGYQFWQTCRLQLDWRLGILQALLVPAAWLAFVLITAPFGGPVDLRASLRVPPPTPIELVAIVATVVLALPAVHELTHGLVAGLLGGRPVFGIGPGLAFCHVREFVGRNAYAQVLGAPLLLISVLGVPLMAVVPAEGRGPLLGLLVANVAGAIGDIALLASVLRLPRAALIADTREGFEVYMPLTADPVRPNEGAR